MNVILAIESSCDETSAAICIDGKVVSNIISSQLQHSEFGGVVPELASRLHQQHIVPVVQQALAHAGVFSKDISAVAFTRGPGLMGALLVGTCFAKAYSIALGIPLIAVNHMQAHVLANFINPDPPQFPFLCLTVSGGHTQIVLANDPYQFEILGQSVDDAAGEAFDKAAKMLGLGYPGGPKIDQLAKTGDPNRFPFPQPSLKQILQDGRVQNDVYNFSFSGIKTSLRYFLRDQIKLDPNFIEKNISDICASYQNRIVHYLLENFSALAKIKKIKELAIAGGVSANSELRKRFIDLCNKNKWKAHIPSFEYCTDNAGMIAISGYYQFLKGNFADQKVVPFSRERFLQDS